ncbi:hypothetical protein [Fusobacterium ulcerans]|uniref:hypothetical protein n=1 Tax=Fusobacterium ulcerans TaxID=861 RepID=UPI003FF06516
MNELGSIEIKIIKSPEEYIFLNSEEVSHYRNEKFEFNTVRELKRIFDEYQIKYPENLTIYDLENEETIEKIKQENPMILKLIIFPEEEKKECRKSPSHSPEELKNQLEIKKQIFEENQKNAQLILKKRI